MSRTVSVPENASATVYLDVSEFTDADAWEDFVDDVRNVIREVYPSFEHADTWVGRETRMILRNMHCVVVIAEYCGLASVSIGPAYPLPLALAWCRRIARKWREHMIARFPSTALQHVATFSNGEAMYKRAI